MDDAGEIHALGSLRRDGSVWSAASDTVFSSLSSRADGGVDDEEALRWAALEKLPTYDRARTAVLAMPEGDLRHVNVQKLDPQERHALLQRLAWVGDDHQRFLSKFKDRVDRVGIDLPKIEVRYQNLNVEAEAYVGSRGLPTILNTYANVLEGIANALHITPSRKQKISILHNVSGIIKPHRMTLLLGPPGAGKTSLLLALAGTLPSSLKVTGNITYNGHTMDEFEARRSAAYVSQHDLHMGELTVRETVNFSARCQGSGHRYDLLVELSRREKDAGIIPDKETDTYMKAAATGDQKADVVTNHILKVLGLDVCADTIVGNNMLRGISGGQKKRVTTAEMLVTPGRAVFMDEISTGLDSSTTFQIVNSIRETIHIVGGTAVIALLQPAPETYDLFDDIILLSDSQVVYSGPREYVLEFFESVGFKCPQRKGVADFLQEVTSKKDQRQYWKHGDDTYRYVPVKEFAEAFQSFHVGEAIRNELAVPFDKSTSHPAALKTSRYGASVKELLKANIDREILLIKRNSFVYIFKAVQLTLMALITMTVFLRTNMHRDSISDGRIYMGALFFGVLMVMFNGLAEVGLTIAKLPVFFKQRDLLFYPAWTYSLPSWIIKTPLSLLNVTIWVFITYYVIGFDPNVERLFRQFLLLLLMNEASSGLFRFIAGLARHQVVASTLGSFGILICMLLGGFLLARENVKKWWIWGYWISPLMYAQNAISVNEFLGSSWNKQVIPGSAEPLGKLVLESRGLFPEAKWYWIGVGALLGYVLLFNILYTICLTFLKPFDSNQPTISEEALKIKHANLTGEVLEASSRGRVASTTTTGTLDESNDEAASNHATVNSSPVNKGMVLPFVPLSITFDDIRYSVDMPELFLMKRGGEEIYVGPLGMHSCELVKYFEGIEGVNKIKDGYNPSTWMLEVTSTMQEQITGINFSEVYKNSELHRRNKTLIKELSTPPEGSSDLSFPTEYSQAFLTQCLACLWKQSMSYWRNPPYTGVKYFYTTVIALLFGTMFWGVGRKRDSQQDLFNAIGSMYASVIFMGVQNSGSVQPVVSVERTVFYRERAAHMYSPLPYALGQVVIELPYIFVQSLIYGVLVYAMIGFEWTADKFFWYLFFMYFTLAYYTFYGMMVVGLTPNYNVSSVASTAFYAIWNLFSGFLIPRTRIPVWWRWFYWICPIAWTLNGLVTSQFGDVTETFSDGGVRISDFVEDYFGYHHDLLWVVAVVVVAFPVLFALLFGLSLKIFNFQKR
ncbi:ABC transporter G family member 40 [Zea mays]|uniref:ABC transporter G family member 40 n=1 Tax=Zea mays TaxID=4577 RepID=A0A1D6I298_MAIZE|nr:ABC transporter G family member 40 [Zea mays]